MQQLGVCTESEAGYHRCGILVHQRLHHSGSRGGWTSLCEVDFWKQDGSMLNHTDVCHLPSGFLFSICFIFGSAYYKQVFDTPIVSPVSNVVLNVVLEELEEHNIPSFIMWLSVWYYHVDSG